MPYILSLDEGTTSARAVLYDERGIRIAMEAYPVESRYPQPGWVEQDPGEIWRSQLQAARDVLAKAGVVAGDIAAIGITNQRETTAVWDRKTGQPVGPAIVWQCRRTADYCTELANSNLAQTIQQKTGLVIDAYFSASKIRWILENTSGVRQRAEAGELVFGNIDTWLIWKLTNGAEHATDVSNASRTMLMNIGTGDWDDELLRIFGVPRSMLPRIVPSSGVCGRRQTRALGRWNPGGGNCRGSAGSALRPGMLPSRTVEEHLRHGMFRADAHRRAATGIEAPAGRHPGCVSRSSAAVRD